MAENDSHNYNNINNNNDNNNNSSNESPVIPDSKPLPDPPSDGISKLSYLPSSSPLLVSTSWDGCLKVHDTDAMECKLSHSFSLGPLLSLSAVDPEYIFVGELGGTILRVNLSQGGGMRSGSSPVMVEKLGQHTSKQGGSTTPACSCLVSFPSSPPLVASAGWHGQFHLWDLRQRGGTDAAAVVTIDLPGKAFCMDMHEIRVVVGCSGRQTCLFDIRKASTTSATATASVSSWTAETILQSESSQKHQTRCVKFFPDGKCLAVGSVEGRVSVDDSESLRKIYAFKCHRDGDLVYPVNCIEFHPTFGTFATGGCDGTVVTWDGANRKRLTSFKFPTSVSAMAFNHDGSKMAIASSYTFEDGEREHPRDEIYIRAMLESECAPKQVS